MIIDEQLLTTFYLCHRKACLLKEEIAKSDRLGITFEADFMGSHLVTKADEILKKKDGQSIAILNRPSKRIRERHIIEAAFLSFILDLNENPMDVYVRILNDEKKINPRSDLISSMIRNLSEIIKYPVIPDPTFSYACKDCPFYKECIDIAIKSGDISLINGVGGKRREALRKAGFSDLKDLSSADPKLISIYADINLKEATKMIKQAQAILKYQPILIERPLLPASNGGYFFDVEKSDGDLYLLGVIHKGIYHHFLLDEDEWKEPWKEFLKFIFEHPQESVYHYDRFDREVIKKFGYLSNMDNKALKILTNRFVDLYSIVTESFALPIRFYSLKEVAGIFGFEWREKDFRGYEAMMTLSEWKRSREQSLMDQILMYNEDDCRALQVLRNGIKENFKR